MLATAIIVFREVLEAALIVGIVLAASRGIALAAPGLPAASPRGLSARCSSQPAPAGSSGRRRRDRSGAVRCRGPADGGRDARLAQFWMTRHGRELAACRQSPGTGVREGARPLWALALAVGLAVLREGSEIVLFLYGIAATAGGAGGLALGAAVVGGRSGWPGRALLRAGPASRCATCSRSPVG